MFSFGMIPKISHYVNANIPKSETNVKSKTFLSPGISEGYSTSNSLLWGTVACSFWSVVHSEEGALMKPQMGYDHLVS